MENEIRRLVDNELDLSSIMDGFPFSKVEVAQYLCGIRFLVVLRRDDIRTKNMMAEEYYVSFHEVETGFGDRPTNISLPFAYLMFRRSMDCREIFDILERQIRLHVGYYAP